MFREAGGTVALLSALGHCLTDNRRNLLFSSAFPPADGYGDHPATVVKACKALHSHQTRLEADGSYAKRDQVADMRFLDITPQVTQNSEPRTTITLTSASPAIGATPS